VAALNEGLLALESRGGTSDVVEPLMRAAHSLKGAARIVGLSAGEQVAHALEDVFVAAQHQKIKLVPEHIDVLLAAVDLLGAAARLAESEIEDWTSRNESLIRERVELLHRIEQGTWAQDHKALPANAEPAPMVVEDIPPPVPVAESKTKRPARAPRSTKNSRRQAAPPVASAEIVAAEPAAKVATVAIEPAAVAHEAVDRVVRVSAENLNRMMGLAGESLVQTRQLRPLVDSLMVIKSTQARLWESLQDVEEALALINGDDGMRVRERLLNSKQLASRCLELLDQRANRLEEHARRGEDLSERLHHEVISSRLRPLIDGVRGFPRLVRDTARQLDKLVRLEIAGEQTGVDRDILEKLEAPLNHLIRNALDHGIEQPAERLSAGKPETASIRLEARHVAGMLQIRLVDDGRGIHPDRIRLKILERGLASHEMVEKMTELEVLEFLFLPGFSTKSEVTALSGRGVGLDVVQSMVQSVGGTVRVVSRPGFGTTFTLQLPITMSVIRALLVRIAGQPYAFPLSRLESIQRVPVEELETIEGRPFFTLDGQSVGLVSAEEVLELGASPRGTDFLPVAVVSERGQRFGIVVEEFLGELDLDVRPLDLRLGKVPNVNSASVLEDGWPVLIFDVEDLVRSIDNMLHGRRFKISARKSDAEQTAKAAKRILVVEDSLTVRELERQLLAHQGYLVDTAVDGMDGWNAVRSVHYDLVVSDIDMPRLDGIGLVSQIRREPKFKNLPVVIVSYKDREEDRLRGLDAGANAYLTKGSFHDRTFLRTVADLIGD
jgi:two-component system sensor histidine kinase and response regulator WspE